MKLKYRLALDMGANSLGWCIYLLNEADEPYAIKRLGARIFSDGRDPKSLASLAANRRLARQTRRRRDRVLKRRHRLMQGLIRYSLMPADEAARKALQALDPYELRAKGLDQKLTAYELGRALYHLARKRGFKSSRKDARNSESAKETGKVHAAIEKLQEQIASAGCRTVGEYLARHHVKRQPVRARRSPDGQYVLYLQRGMVEAEFDALWNAQRSHHPGLLTDAAHNWLKDTLLFQRKLKPVKPGHCLFEPDEYRARLCSPLQQRFRILQELNNLRLINGMEQRPLTLEERNLLLSKLLVTDKMTFAEMREAIGMKRSDHARFNLESEKRKNLKGDIVGNQLGALECFGEMWHELPADRQEILAELIEVTDDASELIKRLMSSPWNFSQKQAEAASRCQLPEDFGSLSRKALLRIVPELEHEVVTYDVAVQRAGYTHHSQLHTGEFFRRLPYYGEILRGYTAPSETAKNLDERKYGKIPNPTVHIGLNQLRQLVNEVIHRYGHPHSVIIELTREFGVSGEHRREIEKQQADNQERNDRYNTELEGLGIRPSRENRLKLQLWEELGRDDALDRYCIYSGQRLSKAMLFSDEVEIDHILPFSRSLHDGVGNKILCTRQANRDKGNRTPFEAFGHSPGRYHWNEILARVERHFAQSENRGLRRKAELFTENALERFLGEKNFLDRHLTDTAYLGRAAKQYLSYICHKDYVWVSSGKLTGMLRGKWGLNPLLSGDSRKNREDHRHHALDAAVIGLCSRSLIQRMATAASRAEEQGENRLLESLDLPWPTFRDELGAALQNVVVSHKLDHGREAALHNDTNYGWRGEPDKRGNPLVGRHVPLESLSGAKDAEAVAAPELRAQLADLLKPLNGSKEIKSALLAFSARTGIRRVILEERLSVIPIKDRRSGKSYRYVKGDSNYCYEIFRCEGGGWDGKVVPTFDANQRGYVESTTLTQEEKPLVMRIRGGDLLAIEQEGKRRIMRVVKFSDGRINLAEHQEANVAARNSNSNDPFKYLQLAPSKLRNVKARLVGVNVLGFVNDPGFRE